MSFFWPDEIISDAYTKLVQCFYCKEVGEVWYKRWCGRHRITERLHKTSYGKRRHPDSERRDKNKQRFLGLKDRRLRHFKV
mmetsp:Transcript_435/g.774  ORF Transcript_435/g.774 Transcript_435/m.774 type:complete len:81 (+) Transcript_435:839-1081(+)